VESVVIVSLPSAAFVQVKLGGTEAAASFRISRVTPVQNGLGISEILPCTAIHGGDDNQFVTMGDELGGDDGTADRIVNTILNLVRNEVWREQ